MTSTKENTVTKPIIEQLRDWSRDIEDLARQIRTGVMGRQNYMGQRFDHRANDYEDTELVVAWDEDDAEEQGAHFAYWYLGKFVTFEGLEPEDFDPDGHGPAVKRGTLESLVVLIDNEVGKDYAAYLKDSEGNEARLVAKGDSCASLIVDQFPGSEVGDSSSERSRDADTVLRYILEKL